MAKKQDTKRIKDEKPKAEKAPAKAKSAKSAGKSASAETTARKSAAPKTKPEAAAEALRSLAAPIAKASGNTAGKGKKTAKSAKDAARRLVPDVPSPKLPQVAGGLDVMGTAKEIGGQIIGFLNTDAGRVIAAEVLIYMAKSLTKAAANTETGKDAAETVINAGARIGAAVASAGAQAIENGGSVAEAGAQAASTAATSATDVAREVAQVAVSTVGSVVADAATKMIRGRGKAGRTSEAAKASGAGTTSGGGETGKTGSESPTSTSPALAAAASTPA